MEEKRKPIIFNRKHNIKTFVQILHIYHIHIMDLINNALFYCKNKDTYPPFKNGLYLEEGFFEKIINENPATKRTYIPALWTNFQIEYWFNNKKNEMQIFLDEWIKTHPNEHGYYTVIQYDDGSLLQLPDNTIVYGACSGNIPIPLIYEDKNQRLLNITKKSFSEKTILCSFVGNITCNHVEPNVRREMFNYFVHNPNFKMIDSGGWTPNVNSNLQLTFIQHTLDSKFALAPRGYGRSSFRFFECFQLGTIPIYIWNDCNWLPFQNKIDYSKLCIVIHVSQLPDLEQMLLSIDENKYGAMLDYYKEIKHLFEYDGMFNAIIEDVNL